MTTPKDNFRDAIERMIWAHSNLSTEDRADVLREFARELEAEDTLFDQKDEHIRKVLKQLGYRLPDSDEIDGRIKLVECGSCGEEALPYDTSRNSQHTRGMQCKNCGAMY